MGSSAGGSGRARGVLSPECPGPCTGAVVGAGTGIDHACITHIARHSMRATRGTATRCARELPAVLPAWQRGASSSTPGSSWLGGQHAVLWVREWQPGRAAVPPCPTPSVPPVRSAEQEPWALLAAAPMPSCAGSDAVRPSFRYIVIPLHARARCTVQAEAHGPGRGSMHSRPLPVGDPAGSGPQLRSCACRARAHRTRPPHPEALGASQGAPGNFFGQLRSILCRRPKPGQSRLLQTRRPRRRGGSREVE